jgi:hypothetical protein
MKYKDREKLRNRIEENINNDALYAAENITEAIVRLNDVVQIIETGTTKLDPQGFIVLSIESALSYLKGLSKT